MYEGFHRWGGWAGENGMKAAVPGMGFTGMSCPICSFPVQERRKWDFLAQDLELCYP